MNWISIAMILVCIITAISGYRRGFTKTVVSMISFLIIILLVSILNPLISGVVNQYTDLDEKTEQYCMEILSERLEGETEPGRNEQISLIENLPVPKQIKSELVENNNNVIYEILGATGFFDYIVSFLAKIILRAVVFLASVLLAWIIVKIVGLCINGVAHMPGISFFNRIAGFALGLVKGLLVIWIFFLIITICSGTALGGYLIGQIQQDPIAEIIYQKNPLVWLLIIFLIL